MKKIFTTLLLSLSLFSNITLKAQFTKLIDFTGSTGAAKGQAPNGSLIQTSDGMIYGVARNGGVYNYGVLFQYNPTNSTYTDKVDFDGTSNGINPNFGLIQANDGMLYGVTSNGGANSYGVLFQYDPTTNILTNKYDFDYTTGGTPSGALIQATDGMLYGVTDAGGSHNVGVIFQFNPNNNTYTKKFDFANATGSHPNGSLIQATDGNLYGVTNAGGSTGGGVIFQYAISSSTYTDKHDFATATGNIPFSGLMQASDGMLYGVTNSGGANNNFSGGVIFQYDPTTNSYVDKYDFVGGSDGCSPGEKLIQINSSTLYGTATACGSNMGTNGSGVIYQYNISTNTYSMKYKFDTAPNDGETPKCSLLKASDGSLYGSTVFGGTNNYGTLFKYNTSSTGIEKFDNQNSFSISPNPTNENFIVELKNNLTKAQCTISDISGRVIISQYITDKTLFDTSLLGNGVYCVSVSNSKECVNKRLVIAK